MDDRRQGGVRHREHVSPLGVLVVGRIGVRISTDHRNLAYIFKAEAFVSSVLRTAAQRLESWKMVLVLGRIGMHIYTDHRSLAYIFKAEAFVSSVPKTAAQRLESWKMVLAQYDYTNMHISGERNC